MNRPLRILLIGDYSNLHPTLAAQFRAMGHEVTVMSDGSYFQQTPRDFDISRRPGRIGGALLTAKLLTKWRKLLKGNDIVSIINPHFLSLKPSRIRYFFDVLRGENRSVFLTAAGTDAAYVRYCIGNQSKLRYNEWCIDGHPGPLALDKPQLVSEWLAPDMLRFNDYIYNNITGAVSALYEYDCTLRSLLPTDKIAYGGIPIDTGRFALREPKDANEPIIVFLGRHEGRYAEKGTRLLEIAAERAVKRAPHARLQIVENVPLAEYSKLQRQADIVLDQVYSYTPATNALMAMSQGIAVVSGAEPEYYEMIGEETLHPIINASLNVDVLEQQIYNAIANRDELSQRGLDSRRFVLKHNEASLVANRYLNFWKSKI